MPIIKLGVQLNEFKLFFFFCRINVEALIKEINAQKNAIKKNGITIDGRHFKVKFTGD